MLDQESLARVLERESPDLVVTDFRLRWTDGLEVLRRVKERWPAVAVVMFTGTGTEEVAVEAMKNDLDDYVVKTPAHVRRLPAAVRSALERAAARWEAAARAEAEAALAATERLLTAVVQAAPVGIVTVDPSGNVTSWNQAAERMFGWSAAEALGHPLPTVPAEFRGELEDILRRTLAGEVIVDVELRRHRKDGSPIEISLSASPLRDSSGETAAVVSIAVDVSERKRLEEELRQSQKMEAIGRLAGGIAHDFNNLLTAIVGHTALLLGALAEGDPRYADAEQVQRAAERAVLLTRQLLAFSRRRPRVSEIVDLNGAVESVVPMLRRLVGERYEIAVLLERDLDRVRADPGQVEQLVMNLVVNATEAMPEGGSVTIETGQASILSSREHGSLVPGRYVTLTVRDTGRGIDSETKARLFEPFFTTKEMGTGLGLATVYGIVAQSSGHIEVESAEDAGATFRVYLPSAGGGEVGEPQVKQEEVHGGSETVLLVEDEEMVRRLARRVLEDRGYIVLVAASAADALELAGAHEGPMDLLLTDVVMPGRSGPELAEELLLERPGMQVLFMSGYAEETFGRLGLGDETFRLQKPFSPALLARAVREALDRAKGEGTAR